MFRLIYAVIILFIFTACNENKIELDGKKLIEEKCAKCHNLDLPPQTFRDEVAPPMMAVSFHIVGFIKTTDESMRVPKAIEFVKDYVMYPSKEKSFCDKKSLEEYGVMPSQKENVTLDELDAIARYMFKHFTQKNLSDAQKAINRFKKMPKGEQLARKNSCLSCHKIKKNLVGPSFTRVSIAYQNSKESIIKSIEEGSQEKWKDSKGVRMPAFKNLSKEDTKILAEWILSLN